MLQRTMCTFFGGCILNKIRQIIASKKGMCFFCKNVNEKCSFLYIDRLKILLTVVHWVLFPEHLFY